MIMDIMMMITMIIMVLMIAMVVMMVIIMVVVSFTFLIANQSHINWYVPDGERPTDIKRKCL